MGKRSFIEICGDLIDKASTRLLLSFALMGITGPIGASVFPPAALISLVAMTTFLSFKRRDEGYIIKKMSYTSENGEEIPCFIVKEKRFIYIPFLSFICFFHYVPHKTNYYLIKNAVTPNCDEKTVLNTMILKVGILNYQQITKAKADAIIADPQIIADEIKNEVSKYREDFCKEINNFADLEIIEEVYYNSRFSIFKLLNKNYLVCNYGKIGDEYVAVFIKPDFAETVKNDPAVLSASYLSDEVLAAEIMNINNTNLERLINSSDKKDSEAAKTVIDEVNREKTPLTKEIIEKKLNTVHSGSNKVLSVLIGFGALACIEGGVAGLVSMMWYLIPLLALGLWLAKQAYDLFKKGERHGESVSSGKYRIEKVICTSIEEITSENSGGGTYSEYIHHFTNGDKYTHTAPLGNAKDIFYTVYLEGTDRIGALYNGIEYHPTNDLIIIDRTAS